jgi:hypothetical protein
VIPKSSKVAGEHTRGRVLLMGFTSGVMFEKLQLVFKIDNGNDHGKFFIKTLKGFNVRGLEDLTDEATRRFACSEEAMDCSTGLSSGERWYQLIVHSELDCNIADR